VLGAAFWAAVQTRVAERLRMRTHSRPAAVSHVRPTMRPADQQATSGCGRPPGPRRVRARVLRRTTLGCLAPGQDAGLRHSGAFRDASRLRGGSGSRCVTHPRFRRIAHPSRGCRRTRGVSVRALRSLPVVPAAVRHSRKRHGSVKPSRRAPSYCARRSGRRRWCGVRTTRPRSARTGPQLGSVANVASWRCPRVG
jgi:hypothetical protein